MAGCTPEVRYISDGCLHFKAIRPTAEEVDMLSAETVRQIFEAYARLGSLSEVQKELRQRGIVSKRRERRSGRALP